MEKEKECIVNQEKLWNIESQLDTKMNEVENLQEELKMFKNNMFELNESTY